MSKILILLPLLLSCSGYEGTDSHTQHLVEKKTEGEAAMIFAKRQANGQHCFYEQSITHENWLKMKDMQAQAGQKRLRQLATSSTLMTPNSLYYKDVHAAMMADSKLSNITTHFSSNYISEPLGLVCGLSLGYFTAANLLAAVLPTPKMLRGFGFTFVPFLQSIKTGKVAAATCGMQFLLYGGAFITHLQNWRRSRNLSEDLLVSRLHEAAPANLARLRKLFVWLESRDAMQCPAQLQLPTFDTDKAKEMLGGK